MGCAVGPNPVAIVSSVNYGHAASSGKACACVNQIGSNAICSKTQVGELLPLVGHLSHAEHTEFVG